MKNMQFKVMARDLTPEAQARLLGTLGIGELSDGNFDEVPLVVIEGRPDEKPKPLYLMDISCCIVVPVEAANEEEARRIAMSADSSELLALCSELKDGREILGSRAIDSDCPEAIKYVKGMPLNLESTIASSEFDVDKIRDAITEEQRRWKWDNVMFYSAEKVYAMAYEIGLRHEIIYLFEDIEGSFNVEEFAKYDTGNGLCKEDPPEWLIAHMAMNMNLLECFVDWATNDHKFIVDVTNQERTRDTFIKFLDSYVREELPERATYKSAKEGQYARQ